MRILIDIGHPAHVHYAKNFIQLAKNNYNDEISVIARDKEISFELLKYEEIPYYSRGKGGDSTFNKILYLFKADYLIHKIAKNIKPDLFISFMTPYPTHVAKYLNKPSIVVTDTEHSVEQIRLFKPFATSIVTPSCFRSNLGSKQIKVDSYLELFYLHPNYFKADESVKKILGLNENENYAIIRFVSWNASHDRGHSGLATNYKFHLINELNKHVKVFISSEEELPEELKQYEFPLPSNKMHDAIAFANLVYGESATMASEAAMLGTPAIYHDNVGRGYTDELERKYGAVFNYSESEEDQVKGISKAIDIVKDNNSKTIAIKKSEMIIKEKEDFTDYLLNYTRNYANK